jgi:hypothetical protein
LLHLPLYDRGHYAGKTLLYLCLYQPGDVLGKALLYRYFYRAVYLRGCPSPYEVERATFLYVSAKPWP